MTTTSVLIILNLMSNISLGGFKKKFSDLKFPVSISNFFSSIDKRLKIVIGILLLIIIVLLTIQQIYSKKITQPISSSGEHSPSATPCISKALSGGLQTYRFSHGKDVVGPKLQVVNIDPFDPQPNQIINITAEIKHDSPIKKAIVTLISDNKKSVKEMKLTGGDTTNGTWNAEIKIEDTYLCIYKLNFDLQSETGNYNNDMVFRP